MILPRRMIIVFLSGVHSLTKWHLQISDCRIRVTNFLERSLKIEFFLENRASVLESKIIEEALDPRASPNIFP